MKWRHLGSLVLLTIAFGGCADAKALEIPPVTVAKPTRPFLEEKQEKGSKRMTRKTDTVDSSHGQQVADPYRWLEDSESSEVHDWTEAQNQTTRRALDAIAGREGLKGGITELLQIGVVTPPSTRPGKKGLVYFYTRREGTQNQPTLYVR